MKKNLSMKLVCILVYCLVGLISILFFQKIFTDFSTVRFENFVGVLFGLVPSTVISNIFSVIFYIVLICIEILTIVWFVIFVRDSWKNIDSKILFDRKTIYNIAVIAFMAFFIIV